MTRPIMQLQIDRDKAREHAKKIVRVLPQPKNRIDLIEQAIALIHLGCAGLHMAGMLREGIEEILAGESEGFGLNSTDIAGPDEA